MKKITLILILLVGSSLISCGKNEEWYGFVFPDSNEMFDYSSIGPHDSLDKCKLACQEELKKLKVEHSGYYQCGKRCVSKSGRVTVAACESIVR